MALPVFSEADLPLTPDQLGQITRALANRGISDPVQTFVDDAVQKIADYTAKYSLELGRWRRLMRPLALCGLYEAIGEMPDAVRRACEAAMKELEDIRAGKFTDLKEAEEPVQEITPRTGAWGSRTKLTFR